MARGSSGSGRSLELALRGALFLEHAVFFVVACRTLNIFRQKGFVGVYSATFKALRNLPGVEILIQSLVRREVEGAVRRLAKSESQITREAHRPMLRLPLEGISGEEILQQLEALKAAERRSSKTGHKSLGYVHYDPEAGTQRLNAHCQVLLKAFRALEERSGVDVTGDHDRLVEMAFAAFLSESTNPSNPALVPVIRKCENEVIAMTASLLHGDEEVVGSLTSGTAESILLTVKTYRDLARAALPHITDPEMILPLTAHPAFIKAGHLFGVRVITVAVGPDKRVSLEAVEAAVTSNTILLVASAPQAPHGVIDPIPCLADMARELNVPLHIDAHLGGFMLPFLEKLGYDVPRWDFRCAGVMSINVDMHRYGYCIKGTSVLLYRNTDLRAHQFFTYTEWPGGVFGSPSLTGSRPGGNIAAAWASMMLLGESGYLALAKTTMDVTERLKEGIRGVGGLGLVAEPDMTCLAIVSRDPKVCILLVGDAMEEKGWWMERQQAPASLHLSVMPHHNEVCDRFLLDLKTSVENVRRQGAAALTTKGKADIYGLVESMPDRSLLANFVVQLYNSTYRLSREDGENIVSMVSPSFERGGLEALGEEDDEEDDEEDVEEEGRER
ncbi:sphingosine-1-phosphate lyase 1 [Nannochloropsis oceanica]